MSAPASEDLRELKTLLEVAADSGEPKSVAVLREELGVGHNDLVALLDVLAEQGLAREVLPGEWSGPDAPDPLAMDGDGAQRVRVQVPDEEVQESRREMPPARLASGSVTVRLTRSIVSAIGAEALGKLVQAGIEDADGTFVLEVTP